MKIKIKIYEGKRSDDEANAMRSLSGKMKNKTPSDVNQLLKDMGWDDGSKPAKPSKQIDPNTPGERPSNKHKTVSNHSSEPKYSFKDEADQLAFKRLNKLDLSNQIVNTLLTNGYVPIVGSKGQIIKYGEGAQGVVFEVTKNSQRFAAKASRSDDFGAERELAVREKVEEIRPSLPLEISKHIVTCYSVFHDKFGDYNIFIMDVMRPMNGMEKRMLYHGISSEFGRQMRKGNQEDYDQRNDFRNAYGYNDLTLDPNYHDQLSKDVKNSNIVTFQKQKEFIEALVYLKEKFDIEFRDLHQLNVMVNPVTRDYVAADIGLFVT